ncbi:MAG: hypothetical protein EBQ92_00630, partial [Proteobacteria bacterium]|nr:hypothetical protein [Pseudomonadota bacterium]
MNRSTDKTPQKKNANKFAALNVSDSSDSDDNSDNYIKPNDNYIKPETVKPESTGSTTSKKSFFKQTENVEYVDSTAQFHTENKQKDNVYVAKVLTTDRGDKGWDNQYKKNRQRKFGFDESPDNNFENKPIYVENLENANELGNNKYFNSPWTVWIHKSDCDTWTEDSYTNAYLINNIGSFWRFFNNFQLIDKLKNQIFIFKNKIKPIWED